MEMPGKEQNPDTSSEKGSKENQSDNPYEAEEEQVSRGDPETPGTPEDAAFDILNSVGLESNTDNKELVKSLLSASSEEDRFNKVFRNKKGQITDGRVGKIAYEIARRKDLTIHNDA